MRTDRTGELVSGTGGATAATGDGTPTPDELVARAEELRPALREQMAATEERGRPSEEMNDRLVEAGFYRMFTPRRYGGYEFTLHDFSRVIVSLAQGCPSTSWFVAFGSGHSLTLATFYDKDVQDETFGPDGHFQAPHSARGENATARRVDGGWIVDGFWPYCSGAPYSTHMMGTAKFLDGDDAPDDGAPPRVGVVLVPKGGYEMLDDWGATLGMRGTGSNSIRVENTFIPENHATEWPPTDGDYRTPGLELHGNPLYMGRWKVGYANESQSVLIGATRLALDSYEDILKTRRLIRPGVISDMRRYQEIGHQRNFGSAMVMLASAEALVQHAGQMHTRLGERYLCDGIPYSDEDEELVMQIIRRGGAMATSTMDLIFASAGSKAASHGEIIERCYRDVSTIKTHASQQFNDTSPHLARLHFGIAQVSHSPAGG
jgi:3-hydroxy-9,10-secoandrosta-1,3,5(10)-triene-9,17-dione monooxygenase